MSTNFDQRIAALAATQHGVFTRRQAAEIARECDLAGVEGVLRHRIGAGRWLRCHPGVLQVAGVPNRWLSDLAAATLARPGCIVSHESAGQLLDMAYVPSGVLSVIGPRPARSLSGVVVHQPRRISKDQVIEIEGLRVTDRATTIIDLAAVLSTGRFTRVLDDQLASRRVKLDGVVSAFERQARRGKKGIAVARQLIEARLDGLVVSESELEHLFRELIAPHLQVAPIYQFQPSWRTDGIGRVDVSFPRHCLIAELDGRRWHLRDIDFENDRRRDQDALEHGWRTVRYTHHQVTRETARVIRNLGRILEPAA